MSPLPLTLACAPYDRMISLLTGETRPMGIDLRFLPIDHPRDVFDRFVTTSDFDLAELSASEYITMHAAGDRRFIALPVFPSRAFRHSFIAVNSDRIKKPKDLEGKRIGVQHYTMTAAVWQRGILTDEYGVDLSGVEWVEGKMEGPGSHGKPGSLAPPAGVRIVRNEDTSRSLSDLLRDGDVDATIGADPPACLGRGRITRLWPDFKREEKEFYKRTKIFPIMHLVAIRREVYEKKSWIATSLFEAFDKSKDLARKRMESTSALRYMLPWLPEALDDIKETFGEDCWPYGVEANRVTLEALVEYLHDQGLITRTMPIEELFAVVKPSNFPIQ
ncbi:hypothetical protein CAC42_6266 [Sphaceloma murrayae]|uniref:Uncharacterized protein n=1 Tax=Sphaceloma murrayae TaxID=2082308 RepID=A0A2K1QTU9_9PEZI|nr:hypothetical protein CAC42_6266 [Sphaceloma murrayae]